MRYNLIKNSLIRRCVFIFGVLSTGLGIVGVFLPLLPTTPFILLAAWCFYRTSPRMHSWLYRQPVLGPALVEWESSRSISRKTKVIATLTILLSLSFMWIKVQILAVKIGVTLFLAGVVAFICSRPEK